MTSSYRPRGGRKGEREGGIREATLEEAATLELGFGVG